MDQNERSALLAPRAARAPEQVQRQGQAAAGAATGAAAGYSSITGMESTSAPDPRWPRDGDGFRVREYARLRRVVLFVTGLTTVLIGAGLLVGLLVPATITVHVPAGAGADADVPAALALLPVP